MASAILRAVTAVLLLFAASCGMDAPTGPAPSVARSITIVPESSTLAAIGETVQLAVQVLDQRGQVVTGASVSWATSTPDVATVTGTGLVTAVANGTANVTATAGVLSANSSVEVRQRAAQVTLSPAVDTLEAPGDTIRLTAEAYDAGGHAIAGLRFAWTSNSESVATVDSTGLVTATGRGQAGIVAHAVGDGAGEQVGSATVHVTRDTFLGAPSFHPSFLAVNTPAPIRIRVAITPTDGLDVAEVAVVQVDEHGTELGHRLSLYDNGEPANADDVPGDGIFSNSHTITPPDTEGLLHYRALVRGHLNGRPVPDRSSVAALTIIEPATSEQVDEIKQTQASALDSANLVLAETSDVASAISAAEAFLRAHPSVASVDRSGDAGITLSYANGLLGGIIFANTDGNGAVATRGGQPASRTDWVEDRPGAVVSFHPEVAAAGATNAGPGGSTGEPARRPSLLTSSLDTLSVIAGDKVLLFEPFADHFAPHNEGDTIEKLIDERLDFEVHRYRDYAATVEVLTNMTDYGLVVLATHGLDGEWILTRTPANPRTEGYWANHLALGSLGTFTAAEVYVDEGGNEKFKTDVSWLAANHRFVMELGGEFPRSVIINNSCQSTERFLPVGADRVRLWEAMREKGARTYYGYTENVLSDFAVARAVEVVNELTQLRTTGEAFVPGQRDHRGDRAEFEMLGDPSMRFQSDRAALVALYNATGGDNWARNDNWLSDLPIDTWEGVTTRIDAVTGMRVTELVLSHNGLVGILPPQLGQLSQLSVLHLGHNHLTGSIPPQLGQLSQLRFLHLGSSTYDPVHNFNQLTGSIPPQLGQLSQLSRLDLGANRLTGSIPLELGKLSRLEFAQLYNNQLTGAIPSLDNLSTLGLRVHYNRLTGCVPREMGWDGQRVRSPGRVNPQRSAGGGFRQLEPC